MDKRSFERNDIQVIINFNFESHEKVFEARTRNISESGMFIDVAPEILKYMDIGYSIVAYVEYQENLFLKTCGYLVRIEESVEESGFAMKYLNLTEIQKEVIQQYLI